MVVLQFSTGELRVAETYSVLKFLPERDMSERISSKY